MSHNNVYKDNKVIVYNKANLTGLAAAGTNITPRSFRHVWGELSSTFIGIEYWYSRLHQVQSSHPVVFSHFRRELKPTFIHLSLLTFRG